MCACSEQHKCAAWCALWKWRGCVVRMTLFANGASNSLSSLGLQLFPRFVSLSAFSLVFVQRQTLRALTPCSSGWPCLAREAWWASAEEVRWLSSRYYTNTVRLGPHQGITRSRLAHEGCWESNWLVIPQWLAGVNCLEFCSDCFVMSVSLFVFMLCLFMLEAACTCRKSYSVYYVIPKRASDELRLWL